VTEATILCVVVIFLTLTNQEGTRLALLLRKHQLEIIEFCCRISFRRRLYARGI